MMMKVVIYEDNLADLTLMKIACESLVEEIEFIHFKDGNKLVRYLDTADTEEISLFIVDLRNGVFCGKDILRNLRAMPELDKHPIVVFSTSNYFVEMVECKSLGANGYVVKPANLEAFEKAVRFIMKTWANTFS
ncbi:response regulator [Flavilitoribacter nigricans]|nr:response regulator [Flavilitoribacter nigricans]